MTAADAGGDALLISFREAADVSFQLAIAVATVACGMAIADLAMKKSDSYQPTIDVSRSILWASMPVRIGPQHQLSNGSDRLADAEPQAASGTCSDAIGLRIACALLTASPRRS